ncbi:MAG TPA: hypothetical protein VF189_04475 [Patescibacteria group bacterium]
MVEYFDPKFGDHDMLRNETGFVPVRDAVKSALGLRSARRGTIVRITGPDGKSLSLPTEMTDFTRAFQAYLHKDKYKIEIIPGELPQEEKREK